MLGGSGSVVHNRSAVLVVGLRYFTGLSPFDRLARRGLPWRFLRCPFPIHSNTFVLRIQAGCLSLPSGTDRLRAFLAYRVQRRERFVDMLLRGELREADWTDNPPH